MQGCVNAARRSSADSAGPRFENSCHVFRAVQNQSGSATLLVTRGESMAPAMRQSRSCALLLGPGKSRDQRTSTRGRGAWHCDSRSEAFLGLAK